MTRNQELALEAVSAFVLAHNTLETLKKRIDEHTQTKAACDILEIQVTMLIYTVPPFEKLGIELGLDLAPALADLRRRPRT